MKWSSPARRIAVAAYLSSIAFVAAHTTNAFVANALSIPSEHRMAPTVEAETANPSATAQQSVDAILRSGLFLTPQTMDVSTGDSLPPPPPLDVAKKVLLLGTVLGKEGGVMAVLEEITSKQQLLYRVGSQIQNVGTLAIVEKDRVLFREGVREEWLDLALMKQVRSGASGSSSSTPVQASTGSQRLVLDRREVNAALADTTRLLTQAQAVPYLNDGKLDGFRLYSVMPMGFFDKIGLRSNDILQRISGVEIRDPGMVLTLLQQLRNERTVRLDLVRNSERQTLTYEIR